MPDNRGVRLIGALALSGALLGVAGCSDPSPGNDPSPTSSASAEPTSSSTGEPTAAPTRPSDTLPPPATTPVPPPTPGSATETVPTRPVKTAEPKPLDKPADAGNDVSVQLTSVRKITAKAKLPGEVTGPALAVSVHVDNGSPKSLDLSAVVVNLNDASGSPGAVMTSATTKRLPARVKARRTASGVYVFSVPSAQQSTVSVTVSIRPGKQVLQFDGKPFS